MTRAILVAVASLAVAPAGCDLGGDNRNGDATTTRVRVVEGVGRDGRFHPEEIYAQLSPGVVTVLSLFGGGGEGGQGSGFVVDGEGYVATNAHVVTQDGGDRQRADQVFVEFFDGNRVAAEIVGDDPYADVALLKLDPKGLSLTPLQLSQSRSIVVGEPVAAIGSPFGERQSLTVGVVSALDRTIQSLTRFQIGDAIQTDAPINPGNSGGPLLDPKGHVIGINAQIKSQSGGGEGVGFAIPVQVVRRSLRELREKGRVDYGYLGVTALALWPQLAQHLGLDVETGSLVQDVAAGSPADKARIRTGTRKITFQGEPGIAVGGDVIVAVDDRKLTRQHDLADDISARSAGEEVSLTVLRDGERRAVQLTLGRRPAGATP